VQTNDTTPRSTRSSDWHAPDACDVYQRRLHLERADRHGRTAGGEKAQGAAHLFEWFDEYGGYHRKDGKVVKIDDDLMSATRAAAWTCGSPGRSRIFLHVARQSDLHRRRRTISMFHGSVAMSEYHMASSAAAIWRPQGSGGVEPVFVCNLRDDEDRARKALVDQWYPVRDKCMFF